VIAVFASEVIEEKIKNYSLDFPSTKNETAEWKTSFPMFVETFDELIEENREIPAQDLLVEEYFNRNKKEIEELADSEKVKEGLEARIRRAYPSLVRDRHFEILLEEQGLDVVYDKEKDVKEGVDHTVKYKGNTFFVHCFTDTRRGKYARKKKNSRHEFEGKHIDLPLDFDDSATKKVGEFFLYSEKHVRRLIDKMEKESKGKE